MNQTHEETSAMTETTSIPTTSIPTDLFEDAGGWSLHLALPGVSEKDVEVQIENGALAVRATRERHVPEGARVLRSGLESARLEREFVLPDGVGPEQVSAELDAGILRVRLARPAVEKASIPVRSS